MKSGCPEQSFPYVVVGAGPAGLAAARLLASRVGPGKVLLISNEDRLPYERPTLSKGALKPAENAIPQLCSSAEFAALGLTFMAGTDVIKIYRAERLIQTNVGDIGYGTLLLSTGATPRRIGVAGDQLPQIHYLRKAVDAEALRTMLTGRPPVAIVGGGFIGLEVAATVRSMGCRVAVVTKDAYLMNRCLPEGVAVRVASMLEDSGLSFRFGGELRAIEGVARVEGVRLADGELIPAEIVVVGIGSMPNSALASAAGLDVDDGIVVDACWRTSDPHIFAAGDVARRMPLGAAAGSRGVRLESWEPAIEHGQRAAAAILGDAPEEPSSPWMWSDQHDLNIQITGNPDPSKPAILREAHERASVIAMFLEQDRITGAITVNDGPAMSLLRRAINEGRHVEAARLADPQVGLREALGMRRRA